MSDDLLAKVVAERNALKEKLAAQQVKASALKAENALKMDDLKQRLKDAEKREFEALVDSRYFKSETSRHISQRSLAWKKIDELEATVAKMKGAADAAG
jgi:primosomal protein N''